jgi:hypothetical protein
MKGPALLPKSSPGRSFCGGCQGCISPTIIADERRIALRFVPQKPKLVQFHVMKVGATPAKLVAIVRATDEPAALAEVITRHPMPRHLQKRLIVLRTG